MPERACPNACVRACGWLWVVMAPSAVPFPPLLLYFLSNGNDECRSLPHGTWARACSPPLEGGCGWNSVGERERERGRGAHVAHMAQT